MLHIKMLMTNSSTCNRPPVRFWLFLTKGLYLAQPQGFLRQGLGIAPVLVTPHQKPHPMTTPILQLLPHNLAQGVLHYITHYWLVPVEHQHTCMPVSDLHKIKSEAKVGALSSCDKQCIANGERVWYKLATSSRGMNQSSNTTTESQGLCSKLAKLLSMSTIGVLYLTRLTPSHVML